MQKTFSRVRMVQTKDHQTRFGYFDIAGNARKSYFKVAQAGGGCQ